MVKVLLFGTGGVGGCYAHVLTRAGADVTTVCRSNYDAVKENGLTLQSKIWGISTIRPHVVRSASDADGPFDFIMLCSKATVPGSSPSTADLIRPAVGPSTTVVLAQNGIGIEEEYQKAFPENSLISGVVYLPTTQRRPGFVEHGDVELFEIGTYPKGANAAAKNTLSKLQKLFQAGHAKCTIHDDIQERRWCKILINASWNPITALTLCTDADVLKSSPMADSIVKTIMMEIAAVAQAVGHLSINEEMVEWQLSKNRKRMDLNDGVEPSMMTDVLNGNKMEVEPIVGNVIQAARRLSVTTPSLDVVYVLITGRNYALGARLP